MSTIYEVWGDSVSNVGLLVSTQEGIADMSRRGLIEPELSPLYSIRAESWDEAMAYHHAHNDWEPYNPWDES